MDKQKFSRATFNSIYACSFMENLYIGAEWHYNTTIHIATSMSPFQAVYGKVPPSIPIYILRISNIESVDCTLATREDILTTSG